MKVILCAMTFFFILICYSCLKISGDITRLEEERDELKAMTKKEYTCNQHCPFTKNNKGRTYCKLDDKECTYDFSNREGH